MGEITLVRHGQANSSATTEAGYDMLTELGHQQAEWLGHWIHAHDGPFDAVLQAVCAGNRKPRQAWGLPMSPPIRV